jgi:hypothetical protein
MNIHLPKSLPHAKLPRIVDRKQPSRDWLMLLTIALAALAASVGWNAWMFLRITNGEVGDAAPAAAAPDISSVDQARAVFLERAAEVAHYQSAYRFVDPNK